MTVHELSAWQKIYLVIKRCIDLFGAILGILLLALPIIIIAIIQKCTSKGPVFFVQERNGRNGKPFKLIKFRSMEISAPKNMISDEVEHTEAYLTKFGKILRETSLDEIPQLFNILKGDMAFIGPRPLIKEDEVTLKIRRENGSYHLRPGLSGLAQIHGRINLSPEDKGKLDGEYYEKFSLWLDIKIFVKTIFKVFDHGDVMKE